MSEKKRGRPPGLPKTGGRKPNPLGPPRRLFVTIPHDVSLPKDEAEARAVIIAALRKFWEADPLPAKV